MPAADDEVVEVPSTVAATARGWRSYVYESEGWLLAAATVTGALAAVANVIFHYAVEAASGWFWRDLASALGVARQRVTDDIFSTGVAGLPAHWWLIPLVPMTGMALLVVLDYWFPGEIHGYGLPRFLEIVNVEGGYIKRRWMTLKTLASAITLGCGMSAGVEGPIAQIGGAIGSTVSRLIRPTPERLRVLIAAGTAAAIAATFGSPMAGVMFAQEVVLLGESQIQSLTLLVVSAGSAAVTSQYLARYHQLLSVPSLHFPINHELLLYLSLGLLCGPLAVAFIRSFYAIKDWVAASPIPAVLRPVAGALIVGVALIFFPQVAGSGYDVINETFLGRMGAPLLLALVVVKMLMTGVTLGFGGSGGVFAPAMFVGAVFGAGFATVVNHFAPGSIAEPGGFALVGMGTLLSAATHAPMTAIFLLFELTRDYDVVVPIMVTAITATITARRLFPESIDQYDLARRGLHLSADSRAHILRQLFVRSLVARDVEPVAENLTLGEFLKKVTDSRHSQFPVVDSDQHLVGMIGMEDLRAVLLARESWPYLIVGELTRRDVPVVRVCDSLFDAMGILAGHGLEQIPVVDETDERRVVGLLKRSELQNFYQKRLLARDLLG